MLDLRFSKRRLWKVRSTIFWDVTPYSLAVHPGSKSKPSKEPGRNRQKACSCQFVAWRTPPPWRWNQLCSSEPSVNFHKTTQHHMPWEPQIQTTPAVCSLLPFDNWSTWNLSHFWSRYRLVRYRKKEKSLRISARIQFQGVWRKFFKPSISCSYGEGVLAPRPRFHFRQSTSIILPPRVSISGSVVSHDQLHHSSGWLLHPTTYNRVSDRMETVTTPESGTWKRLSY
jgi:hypothetical protein